MMQEKNGLAANGFWMHQMMMYYNHYLIPNTCIFYKGMTYLLGYYTDFYSDRLMTLPQVLYYILMYFILRLL